MAAIKAAGRRMRRWSVQLGIGLVLLAISAATAWAEPATQQVIPATELPPIICEGGTYVGVSGSFTFVAREGTAASGNTQFGGTATAHDVVVTDGSPSTACAARAASAWSRTLSREPSGALLGSTSKSLDRLVWWILCE